MKNYLHFTAGDNLLFQTWHPDSSGAIAGACIGLVVIALLERWLFAIRSGLESYWHHRDCRTNRRHFSRALGLASKDASAAKCGDDAASANSKSPASSGQNQRTVPPFIAAHDVSRGAIYAVQALLGYILMLAVMTFQAAYVISIILGLGIGEVLFGRMNHHNA
ncbi:Ctr copper transporter [Lentinula raphanica]|nr:Ctr copper transporter [Lentinula raphanica]